MAPNESALRFRYEDKCYRPVAERRSRFDGDASTDDT